MSDTATRCEHDGIKWWPRVTVEKYSPDQSAFAEARLAELGSWGRRPLVARFGLDRLLVRQIAPAHLHGDWLRDVFPAGPEDGYARTEGNALVNGGLDALANLVIGAGTPQALTHANAICGVGAGTTAWAAGQAALVADGTNAWYRAMDTSYPAVDGTTHGQLDGQSTFGSTEANGWAWTEWCWASSTSTSITAGATLSGVTPGTEVMFNRWTGTSLGSKGAGATWVFSTTITFS